MLTNGLLVSRSWLGFPIQSSNWLQLNSTNVNEKTHATVNWVNCVRMRCHVHDPTAEHISERQRGTVSAPLLQHLHNFHTHSHSPLTHPLSFSLTFTHFLSLHLLVSRIYPTQYCSVTRCLRSVVDFYYYLNSLLVINFLYFYYSPCDST